MKGKLIVIEGSDGSGKATQSGLLYEALKKEGYSVKLISFPNYESDSSALVKMYLNGELGDSPEAQNTYAVSMFYAVDRYTSFVKDWKDFYEAGGIILCDRYTTSNMVHQGAKMEKPEDRIAYYQWLMEMEYHRFGLPEPDQVFFLDVHPDISKKLRDARKNKITQEEALDIHEKNNEYMRKSYESAQFAAAHLDWVTMECATEESIKSKDEIHQALLQKVKNLL